MFAGPNHFNVVVEDIDAIKSFYTDVVGLKIKDEFEISEPQLSRGLGVDDAKLKVIFWHIPESETTIEMVEYVSPTSVGVDKQTTNRLGYGHLAFTVADIDSVYDELTARGAAFVSPPVTVAGGVRFCFFKDPEGNILEIIQPLPEA
jgi:catechol 2,3-dioxygenase-like lactoylglutathione lyase family enzyme